MSSVEFSLVSGSMMFDGKKFVITDYSTRQKRILLASVISVVLLFVCLNFLRTGSETGSPFHSIAGAVTLIMGIVYVMVSSRGGYFKGIVDEIPIETISKVELETSEQAPAVLVRFRIQNEEDIEVHLRREFRQEEILLNILSQIQR